MRVALVTGGAVRIGRAISAALAEDGYRLVVHYNSSSNAADALVEEIRAKGGEAVAIGADLADAEAVRRLANDAVDAFGGIDLLVNNASVFPSERLEETDEALWDHTFAVNLRAPFFLIRHLAATLRERRGVVVNMADLAGIQTWAAYAAHGISKAGVIHLTRVAARSLAPEVRVNGIAPGTVLPPESMTDDEVRQLAERTPLKRNGGPEDVVRALRYLLQADFVTGETLTVDGGRLLRG
ncbi:MAG TPA: SDR family oxidoreductase [Longimicrobium sp.]|jgi:pteridine reductase|uniref:SDR family oxidoreductase n=1 Tax=Longimicrobium sp. TaxID=2029185 RepID=UPI002ED8094E